MKEISLFSGAGGGLLGSKLLGWNTVGYVEFNPYCQKVLAQRIKDGILDEAPIFGDIRSFIRDGYAASYQGVVDVITGGFPCQPFSVAGKGLGENDPRNMWSATIECIRIIRPRFAFLENVPGLLNHRYIERIFGDLAESGYDCRWDIIGASDVGANHRRKRLWILAYAQGEQNRRLQFGRFQPDVRAGGQDVADTEQYDERSPQKPEDCGEQHGLGHDGNTVGHDSGNGGWWSTEPAVGRVVDGFPSRVDRLKAIGNGQVPLCMAYAFSVLSQGIIESEVTAEAIVQLPTRKEI